MKRTMVDDGTILFHKIGGGSFRTMHGKIIKPNQKFRARPEEIPEAFRDVVVAMEPLPEDIPIKSVSTFSMKKTDTPADETDDKSKIESEKAPKDSSPNYEVQKKGGGWYNVFETVSGKKMNEKAMRESDAKALLEALQD